MEGRLPRSLPARLRRSRRCPSGLEAPAPARPRHWLRYDGACLLRPSPSAASCHQCSRRTCATRGRSFAATGAQCWRRPRIREVSQAVGVRVSRYSPYPGRHRQPLDPHPGLTGNHHPLATRPRAPACPDQARRVAPGISARGSHRSVRKPLGLYGSCHPVHQTPETEGTHTQCANIRGNRSTIPRQHRNAFPFARSRLYFLRIQRIR
jgi:hypothetical protein